MDASPLKRWLGWGVLLLVALMPFHAFAVTWLGSITGHRSLWQAWKEILLVGMAVITTFYLLTNREKLQILQRPLNLLVITFALIGLIVSLVAGSFGSRNFWFGAKIDLEFLLAFVIAQLAASNQLEKQLQRVLAVTASVVAAFGLLQIYALPVDFLRHFGYSTATIEPFERVDPAVSSIRILSTLGGPNQLGAFMILPVCLFAYLLIRRRQLWAGAALFASVVVLFHSYSRSAWLGVMVALFVTLAVGVKRKWLIIGSAAMAVLILGIFALSRNALIHNTNLEYYLLHGHIQSGAIKGSDEGRVASLRAGAIKAVKSPLGDGLGSSGPATLHTESANVTENYYLQIAIETGVAGLVVFMAIQILLAIDLLRIGTGSDLAPPLLGALAGILVVNLFLHGWADSSTAMVFWLTAGTVVGNTEDHHV